MLDRHFQLYYWNSGSKIHKIRLVCPCKCFVSFTCFLQVKKRLSQVLQFSSPVVSATQVIIRWLEATEFLSLSEALTFRKHTIPINLHPHVYQMYNVMIFPLITIEDNVENKNIPMPYLYYLHISTHMDRVQAADLWWIQCQNKVNSTSVLWASGSCFCENDIFKWSISNRPTTPFHHAHTPMW